MELEMRQDQNILFTECFLHVWFKSLIYVVWIDLLSIWILYCQPTNSVIRRGKEKPYNTYS